MGLGSGLARAFGAGKGAKYWAPGRSYLDALQGHVSSDVERLYSPNAFTGPGLGFTPAEMGARIGEGVDQAQSEYASNLSDIERQASLRGPSAATSGAFYRNRQRAAGGLLGRSAETRRKNVLANAIQGRQDLYNRLGTVQGERGASAGYYNALQAEKYRARQEKFKGLGQVADAGLAAWGGV